MVSFVLKFLMGSKALCFPGLIRRSNDTADFAGDEETGCPRMLA